MRMVFAVQEELVTYKGTHAAALPTMTPILALCPS